VKPPGVRTVQNMVDRHLPMSSGHLILRQCCCLVAPHAHSAAVVVIAAAAAALFDKATGLRSASVCCVPNVPLPRRLCPDPTDQARDRRVRLMHASIRCNKASGFCVFPRSQHAQVEPRHNRKYHQSSGTLPRCRFGTLLKTARFFLLSFFAVTAR